ncbi:uncharacterized protein CBL_02648 [Carabus blaptoides fortunei]
MAGRFGPLSIIKQTNRTHTGTVIFFHGSGDTGKGIHDWVKALLGKELTFPHIQIVYPTAPLQPYTPLNGAKSHVWFDRLDISPDVPEHKESLDNVCTEMIDFIKNEVASGIPLNRIIVGGFSMGGCLAMHLGYRYMPGVAGVFALSSFLNNNSLVYDDLKSLPDDDERKHTPLFMCHGQLDDLVPIEWGQNTLRNLTKHGITRTEFNPLKNALHELRKEEIHKLNKWIFDVLPPLENE